MKLGVRWTVGDVSPYGFEALRYSILGAWKLFGSEAEYMVWVNTLPVSTARERTGKVPAAIQWARAERHIPEWLKPSLEGNMAEGAAWKLAPVRTFPDLHELALDNDCILWELPDSVVRWLGQSEKLLVAEDVKQCCGRFAHLCGREALNAGLRGLPPAYDFEQKLQQVLKACPGALNREVDEQGLQSAALLAGGALWVSLSEVTICSPFAPHMPGIGKCGAHFCGLNARTLPWEFEGRPGDYWLRRHWEAWRNKVARKVL